MATLNVCVIGNSHVAAVQEGLRTISEPVDFAIDFYGSSANSATATTLRDGRLIALSSVVSRSWAHTSSGKIDIDLQSYNLVVLHGYLPSVPVLVANRRRLLSGKSAYSLALLAATIVHLNPTLGHLLELMKSVALPDLRVTPRPCHTELPLAIQVSDDEYQETVRFVSWALSVYGASFVPQPAETLVDNVLTRGEFALDGLGIGSSPWSTDSSIARNDSKHMNGLFGTAYLRSLGLLQ